MIHIAKKGDIVIQEIVKEENGNSVDVFNRFADFVQSDIWLTVRRDLCWVFMKSKYEGSMKLYGLKKLDG